MGFKPSSRTLITYCCDANLNTIRLICVDFQLLFCSLHWNPRAVKAKEFALFLKAKEEMPNKRPSIHKLPNEVLIKIFSYLSLKELLKVCAKVCRRFQQLTQNEELWTRINLSEKSVDFQFIVYAITHGTKYLSLNSTKLLWKVW